MPFVFIGKFKIKHNKTIRMSASKNLVPSVFVFVNLMIIIVLESLDMSIISFKTFISCSLFISICKLNGKYNSSHSCFRDRFSCLKSNNLNFTSENVLDHISFFFFYNALFFELRLFFCQ